MMSIVHYNAQKTVQLTKEASVQDCVVLVVSTKMADSQGRSRQLLAKNMAASQQEDNLMNDIYYLENISKTEKPCIS